MPWYVLLIAVVVVIVVIAAYALGTYLRRRSEDQPILPPMRSPAPAPQRAPVSAPKAPAKTPTAAEIPDREVRVVVNWLLNQAFEQTGHRVADDKLAYDRIVAVAKLAVDSLKTQDAYDVSLPFLTADSTGPKHLEARLTRDMIAELVKY